MAAHPHEPARAVVERVPEDVPRRAARTTCRIREWQELERQLRQIAKQLKLPSGQPRRSRLEDVDADAVHQALLSGLLSHIGLRDPEQARLPRRPRGAVLDLPGVRAVPEAAGPRRRRRARGDLAALRPHQRRDQGRVGGGGRRAPGQAVPTPSRTGRRSAARRSPSRRSRVYGVPIVADRLVAYGKIDPELSRELFIRHALVYGEWETRHRFFAQQPAAPRRRPRSSRSAPGGATSSSTSTRSSTSTTSGSRGRSCPDATSTAGGRRSGSGEPELLTFDPAMLVRDEAAEETERDFPRAWHEGPLSFSLSYHFEPGAADDGVTIDIPVETLNQVAGRDVHLDGARAARGAGRGADPFAAQEPAGQLRAGAEPRPRLPRRGPAGGGAAPRRAGAAPARRHRRARALARPGTGPRSPSTCAPATGSSTRTGRRSPRARTSPRCAGPLAGEIGRGARRRRRGADR